MEHKPNCMAECGIQHRLYLFPLPQIQGALQIRLDNAEGFQQAEAGHRQTGEENGEDGPAAIQL